MAHIVLESDSSPVVRATAIRVIGRAGLEQRAASLSQALDDPDPDVRATAVELSFVTSSRESCRQSVPGGWELEPESTDSGAG